MPKLGSARRLAFRAKHRALALDEFRRVSDALSRRDDDAGTQPRALAARAAHCEHAVARVSACELPRYATLNGLRPAAAGLVLCSQKDVAAQLRAELARQRRAFGLCGVVGHPL